jgi:hypothetical protein
LPQAFTELYEIVQLMKIVFVARRFIIRRIDIKEGPFPIILFNDIFPIEILNYDIRQA